MKNLKLRLLTGLFLLALIPMPTEAATMSKIVEPKYTSSEPPEHQKLKARLAEIKALDKSDFSFSEKRELRQEKRSIKKRLYSDGGGIYISVGALLVVIILLKLLL
jgi:hypothetical protein